MEVSTPFMENRSLIETGRPCSGPSVLPVLDRYSSISLAVVKASLKRISVQHVVSWWASAARLANARVSSREDRSPVDNFRSRMVMSVSSVRASSVGVRCWRIYGSAFGAELMVGMISRRHSGGIRDSCSARFLAARSW